MDQIIKEAVENKPFDLSVVIPCSRPKGIEPCLRGLLRQKGGVNLEVIVVGDVEGIRERDAQGVLHLVDCSETHSNFRRNRGISMAKAGLIAFLDDDTVPDEGWAQAAVQLDPWDMMIFTGPERPMSRAWKSHLVYAVSQNPLTEGLPGHVNPKTQKVRWNEVPFCNCVIPKKVFDEVGLPSTSIPWDMDDFEFCRRAKDQVEFRNQAELSIRHDRYPDSLLKFLRYKFRLRVRTGEKLFSHPEIYARIPTVLAVALTPLLALLVLAVLCMYSFHLLIVAGAACFFAYILLIASQAMKAHNQTGTRGIFPYLAVMVLLHGVTVIGVQLGMVRGMVQRNIPSDA